MRNSVELWSRPEFPNSGGRGRRLVLADHPRTRRARLLAALLGMAWMAMAPVASAIELSHDHAGQYLILPFALATERYDTLVQVNNSMDRFSPRALKLRVLDRDGAPVLTGNLYLRAGETWAAALAVGDGTTRLITSSPACLLIESGGEVVPADIPALDFESGLIEWVEMGVVADPDFHELLDDRNCAGLAALWSDPDWAMDADGVLDPPAGGLRASASLIDVERGTMYSLTAAALDEFSTIVQHTAPGEPDPNLATTFDEGTPDGQTRSVVCHRGECITDTWAEPIDAASAALMVHEARGDFVISESIGARTEWVVTYPTRAYYPENHPFNSALVSLFLRDRSGRSFAIGFPIPTPPFDFFRFGGTSYWIDHLQSVNFLDFNQSSDDVGMNRPSSIFGLGHTVQFPTAPDEHSEVIPVPESGQARTGFDSHGGELVSNAGRGYLGRPAIVWLFQEFENGVLEAADGAQQRANYGNAVSTSTIRRTTQD